ncbi:ABC transporter substrate-binding protein [Microcystis sp. BLCC-F210]|jgi:multiple sugar transport system substrate-binding protein
MLTSTLQKLFRSTPWIISIFLLTGCGVAQFEQGMPDSPDRPLQVWWSEGYYPEETEAIRRVIDRWETTTGKLVELTFYSEKDLVVETEKALQQGTLPDVIYGYSIDTVLIPKLAWNDQLADVTSIIEPLKKQYIREALDSVYYFNHPKKARSYYAVPISQSTTHIHYWQDFLSKAKVNPRQLPQEWSSFWQIWKTAQTNLRQQGETTIYGLGLPMSSIATDTNNIFEQFLEAYNVQLVDDQGNLNLDSSQERQGIVAALKNYTDFYQQGFVPPQAITWNDPDNNVFFLSNLTVMTANPTLSIPGSQRQDPINYNERMRTIPWPNKPDKTPMRNITYVKQIAIFQETSYLKEAKSLVTFLVQPENLAKFIEGSQGRFFPVMPVLMKRPLWNNPQDAHLFNLKVQFDNPRLAYTVFNPAYSEVLSQNIWGQAIQKILIDRQSPEQAADFAINKIKNIFENWQ